MLQKHAKILPRPTPKFYNLTHDTPTVFSLKPVPDDVLAAAEEATLNDDAQPLGASGKTWLDEQKEPGIEPSLVFDAESEMNLDCEEVHHALADERPQVRVKVSDRPADDPDDVAGGALVLQTTEIIPFSYYLHF